MPSSKGTMKNHKIGQERAFGVVVADLSKKGILLRGLAPTSKSKVLSHLASAPTPCGLLAVSLRAPCTLEVAVQGVGGDVCGV